MSPKGSLANTIGTLNPFRYRGYYYNAETGFYYVSSRYYDSEIGRWINADGVISGVGSDVKGYNVFAYCFNNPVNLQDETGNWPSWKKIKKVFKAIANDIIKIGKSIVKSTSVEIESGLGLGASAEICESVEVNVLVVPLRDKLSIKGTESEYTIEMEFSAGIEVAEIIDFAPSATYSVDKYDIKDGNGFYNNPNGKWTFDSSLSDDVVFSLGASFYLILGLGVDISFNLSECIEMIME